MTNGEQMTAGQDSTYERGVAMRRRVLGDAHVDRAMALLQTAVYCGAPAALESFRVAERVLAEMGVE